MESKISFEFGLIYDESRRDADPLSLVYAPMLLLDINAPFRIVVDGRPVFDEPDFPIVELAQQLHHWNQRGPGRSDFVYQSVEADEPALIAYRNSPGGWSVESPWLTRPFSDRFTFAQLDSVSTSYVRQVVDRVRKSLGIEVADVVQAGPW